MQPLSNWMKSWAFHRIRPSRKPKRYKRRRPRCSKWLSRGRVCTSARFATLHLALCHASLRTHTDTRSTFSPGAHRLLLDTGASVSMSPCIDDFILPPKPYKGMIRGLGQARAQGIGTLRYRLEDDLGLVHTFLLPDSLYVPDLTQRLLVPQHLAQTQDYDMICTTTKSALVLRWEGNTKTIPFNSANVPITYTATNLKSFHAQHPDYGPPTHPMCFPADPSIDSDDDIQPTFDEFPGVEQERKATRPTRTKQGLIPFNFHDELAAAPFIPKPIIDDKAAQLARYHVQLGHMPESSLRALMRSGHLPNTLLNTRLPPCAACAYGKQTRKPWRYKPRHDHTTRMIKQAKNPGDCVSVDQLDATEPGFIGQLKGSLTRQRYRYATVFVDHYSRLSYVHLQKTTSSVETLEAKLAFEKFAASHGVTISHYHADNGRFVDNLWDAHIAKKGQTQSLCGVNAHWQNGVAEKRIRDLLEKSRTLLLDAMAKWPQATNTNLWSYALLHANSLHQVTPLLSGEKKGRLPLHLFTLTGDAVHPNLSHYHTFGCPVYVLDGNLQNGRSIKKWLPRARLGMYLGNSPSHASSVSLVLHLNSGCVSPQFHVRHDDMFETLSYQSNRNLDVSAWKRKAGFKRETPILPQPMAQPPDPFSVPINDPIFDQVPEPRPAEQIDTTPTEVVDTDQQFDTLDIPPSTDDDTVPTSNLAPPLADAPTSPSLPPPASPTPIADDNEPVPEEPIVPPEDTQITAEPVVEPLGLRRSSRQRKFNPKIKEYLGWHINTEDHLVTHETLANPGIWEELDVDSTDTYCYSLQPHSILKYHEVLKEPDKDEFFKAMSKEVNDHEERKHWRVIHRSQIPKGHSVLPSVWSFVRKVCKSTGRILKYKARLTVGGHKQIKGVNYWETYSPVVQWSTIRLFLALTLLHGWHSRQLDFVLAYPQADTECDIFMALPQRFNLKGKNNKDYCLQLIKNIYGQKQGGRIWYNHLCDGLAKLGFTKSKVDPCVFYRGKTILLIYVDDVIVLGPTAADTLEPYNDLIEFGFKLEDQGDIKDFVGVTIEKQSDGAFIMTQKNLIRTILRDLGFNNRTKPKLVPALIGSVLQKHLDSPPHNAEWEYRSVLGKYHFLEKSTRPDLSFATHNAARFAHNPREPHTKALQMIGRYLLGTADKGLIFKPTKDHHLDVYVDAEFGGHWEPSLAKDDMDTARSRIGFIIQYGGIPIIWSSKLTTEICLSTTESEYVALSESMRSTIPLMHLLDELEDIKIIPRHNTPRVHCKVFEDNSGALELAKVPKLRPRTKHINVKYHHFRYMVDDGNGKGRITVHPIDTKDQIADIFTKAVSHDLFFKFRKLMQGW